METYFLLIYSHKHGQDHALRRTEADAWKAARNFVTQYRDEYEEFDGCPDEDVYLRWTDVTNESFEVVALPLL